MDTSISKRRRKTKPSIGEYNEGVYKWAVYYMGEDGKRTRRKFTQKNDASAFLADKLVEVENLGNRIASTLDDDVKRDAYAAIEMLRPFGKSILDATKHYCAHLEATVRSAPIADLVEQFKEAKIADGKSKVYIKDIRARVNCFARDFGTRFASEITTKDIQEWLAGLMVGNLTRNNYRRVLSAFFSWCWRLGYCPENPILKVSKAKSQPSPIGVYTAKEMRRLLRAVATCESAQQGRSDLLANVVFCGFAGLRQSEFERLTWEQVKIDRGVIDLSATITKTAARRIVTIRPVLLAWLKHMGPFQKGPVCKLGFERQLKAFRRDFRFPWKHNALRHSFASYLMEEIQHPGEVSLQLGHSDAGVVFAHYRALVTPEDSKAYWALTPDLVLKGADIIPIDGSKLMAS